MRLLCICTLFLLATSAQGQEGRSGTIKVRRSTAQTYYIPVDSIPTLLSSAAGLETHMAYSNGMVQFSVACDACPSSGLVWLTVNCSNQGEVEAVSIQENDHPEIAAQILSAAKTSLRFKPMVLEGRTRAIQFVYPVMFAVQ